MSEAEEVGKPEEAGQGDNSEGPTSDEPSSQGDNQPTEIASQLMQNPQVLAALQSRLGDIVGSSSGYIQSLPKPVKRRIKALKKLQFDATKIEAEFYREVHKLECKYAARYAPLYEKRQTVVTGEYEPNDEEADWPSDDEKDEELSDSAKATEDKSESQEDVKNKASIEEKGDEKEKTDEEEKEDSDVKGIPGFWLTIFKNVEMLADMIQPHDEPILNALSDVKVDFVDGNDTKDEKDPMGFKLQFHFDSNEYFENKVLTKEYVMRSVPDETDPFAFEGPEIVKCQGCTIDWKKGKNVTVKTVKKKQKHKASGTTRTISKTVQSDSFFNFFNPPTPPDDEEMDEDTETLLAADFEIGHFIRERIVPRAVLYFTGEALENDDEYEDADDEEGGEEEYDEDADPDFNPQAMKFITPRFQAKCAKLALAQVSKPSSAPSDTRLFLRPDSASNPRPTSVSVLEREPAASNSRSVRPVTAPFARKSIQNEDENDTKPSVKKEAFTRSNSDAARPKSVSFKTTQFVGIEDQGEMPKLEKEITKILSSVSDSRSQHRPEIGQIKLTREQTFFEQVSDPHNEEPGKSGMIETVKQTEDKKELEPKEHINEEDFPQSTEDKINQKMNKDGSKQTNKNSNKNQDMVQKDDKIPVLSREVEEKKDLKHITAKTDTGLSRSRKFKQEEVKRQTMSTTGKGTEIKSNSSKAQAEKETNAGLSSEPSSEARLKSGIKVLRSSNNRVKDDKNCTEKVSDNVMGETLSQQKPGCNTASLKTISKEDESSDIVKKKEVHTRSTASNRAGSNNGGGKKTASTEDTAFTILRNLTGKRGHGTHKPGQVPSVNKPVRKYKFDKPSGPSSSQIIQAIIADKQPSLETQNEGRRPPVEQERPAVSAQSSTKSGKDRTRSVTSSAKSQNAGVVVIPHSANQQKSTKSATKRTPGQVPKDCKGDKPGMTGSKGQDSIAEVEQETFTPDQTKGVRLQNGMIATNTVESNEFSEQDKMDSYSDMPNLHPKFRQSPYLKDNPLLMSGKPRLRGSACSAGRSKDTSQ